MVAYQPCGVGIQFFSPRLRVWLPLAFGWFCPTQFPRQWHNAWRMENRTKHRLSALNSVLKLEYSETSEIFWYNFALLLQPPFCGSWIYFGGYPQSQGSRTPSPGLSHNYSGKESLMWFYSLLLWVEKRLWCYMGHMAGWNYTLEPA